MDINRVRYFLAFCETLSFTETAHRLKMSQPALTRALLKLENEVGGSLIRREGKHTHLTPFGKLMHQQFEALENIDRQTHRLAREYVSGPAQTVKIAVMCTIGPRRFSRFLAHYCNLNPKSQIVLLDLEHACLVDHLLEGHVDCALVGTAVNDEQRLRSMDLYSERLVVAHAINHAFSSRDSVSLEDITQEPYLDRLKCEFRSMFLEKCRTRNINAECAILCENDQWIQSLICIGAGVSIMPEESVMIDGVATTEIDGEDLHRKVSLVVAAGREDTADIRNFMHEARAYPW